ncbi:MAG: chemotaxis protein CheW [Myxococcota bacterium]
MNDDDDQILIFELEDEHSATLGAFGVDVSEVGQVIEPSEPREVPRAPAVVEGIMSYGGRIVTVVDPAPILGFPAQGGLLRHVIIVRDARRAIGNLGLKVSRIRQIVKKTAVAAADIAFGAHVKRVVQFDSRLVHVIDVAAFMDGLAREFGSVDAAPAEGVKR